MPPAALSVEESNASDNVLQLFPWVFQRASPTVDEDDSILDEAAILAFRQVDFLPVLRARKVTGRAGGFEIVKVLREIRDFGFQHLMGRKIADVCKERVGLVAWRGVKDSLQSLLDAMLRTEFGHACIVEDRWLLATVSLRDIIRYATSLVTATGVQVADLANPAISLPSDATVSELLDLMVTKRVRRVVVEAGGGKVADDRCVVEHAFSAEGLTVLRDRPDDFFNLPLGNLPLREATSIDGKADVAEAWGAIYTSPAECLLVDGKIVTPWDLTLRVYRLGKFPGARHSFEDVVARCFETTLRGILGETGSEAVFIKLETAFALTPSKICIKAEEFPGIITQVFGPNVGPVFQRAFLRALYSELRIPFVPYSEFKESLNYANERFKVSVFQA